MEGFMTHNNLNGAVSQICCVLDGDVMIGEECIDGLKEIRASLLQSQKVASRFHLALTNVIPQTLVPLVMHLDDEESILGEGEQREALHHAIWIMACLTQPTSPSSSQVRIPVTMSSKSPDRILSDMHEQACRELYKPDVTQKIAKFIMQITEDDVTLNSQDCGTVGSFFYLWRNMLYLTALNIEGCNMLPAYHQTEKLFSCGLKQIIMNVVTSKQLNVFCESLVQLLAILLKKDQSDQGEKKSLVENSLCCSGTDDTMEHSIICEHGTCYDSRSLNSEGITADTLEMTKENISSSDEGFDSMHGESEDQNQTDGDNECSCFSMRVMSDLLKQSMVEESQQKTTVICPSAELDIKRTLMELDLIGFAKNPKLDLIDDILKDGFDSLVAAVLNTLLDDDSSLPELYLFWLISHFLQHVRDSAPPVGELAVLPRQLRRGLSPDAVGYVVYVAVRSQGEIMFAKSRQLPLEPNIVRTTHLAVTALLDIFTTVEYFEEVTLDETDTDIIDNLKVFLVQSADVRGLWPLAIRNYDASLLPIGYLADLILSQHKLLLVIDQVFQRDLEQHTFALVDHLKEFATRDIMGLYGKVLGNLMTNSDALNEAVFTMMYRVAGECDALDTLFQEAVVLVLMDIASCEIWESLPQSWQDMIEHVVEKCVHLAESDPIQFESIWNTKKPQQASMQMEITEVRTDEIWADDERNELQVAFIEALDGKAQHHFIQYIQKMLLQKGIQKSEKQVMLRLLDDGMLPPASLPQIADQLKLSDQEKVEIEKRMTVEDYSTTATTGWLKKWLQDQVTALIRLKLADYPADSTVMGSFLRVNKPVPLVPYTDRQQQALSDDSVCDLLTKLNITVPSIPGSEYPTISDKCSTYDLLQKLEMLGTEQEKMQELNDAMMESTSSCYGINPAGSQYSDKRPGILVEETSQMWHVMVHHHNKSLRQKHLQQDNSF